MVSAVRLTKMAAVDKESALFAWAGANPFLTDTLLFDYLQAKNGSCSLSPLNSGKTIKTYVDGTAIKEYRFAIQVMLQLSSAEDDLNTQNMFTLRKWQDWIEEQEAQGNYPDFGEKCSGYKLENINEGPALVMKYENDLAKYNFHAKLTYMEGE